MARRANLSADEYEDDNLHNTTTTTRQRRGHVNVDSLSPSPLASFSSDKENQEEQLEPSRQKGKGRAMAPPHLMSPAAAEDGPPRSNKRQKLSERGVPNATQTAHENALAGISDARYYDPDQSIEERRLLRKDFRDLSKELTGDHVPNGSLWLGAVLTAAIDSRTEYLAPGSRGLVTTLEKANDLFTSVKQTSDATLDSRLLVSTADLSAKRTTQLNLGESTTGIDVDDFVGRCITFMRRGPVEGGTQRRRRDEDDSDQDATAGYDEGDEFNWAWLGRQACFPNNLRPAVPGFLLGPLSVQKRARKATQRRERLVKRDPKDAVRPEELKAQDMEKVENSNLTTLCKNIRELLVKTMNQGLKRVYDEMPQEISDEDGQALMTKHNVADDGGVPFFHFVMNPKSFGQTVENLFYVSFLIRDGVSGFGNDSRGLPTIHATDTHTAKEVQEQKISKHQAVFHLDFETWEDIVETYDIKESIIPHRHSDEEANVAASGWYA